MESSGGEHLCRVIWLEMQWHLQLGGEDLGSPQQVRRRREGAVERHVLAQKENSNRSCYIIDQTILTVVCTFSKGFCVYVIHCR